VDHDDVHHSRVAEAFASLAGREALLTHNYVVVESTAVVERRLGREVARRLLVDLLSPVDVVWVDESIHGAATSAYLAAGPNAPSLVDFTSFEVMRLHGIRTALAVDRDFGHAGFEVIPSP
jgi:uncharacterized protein